MVRNRLRQRREVGLQACGARLGANRCQVRLAQAQTLDSGRQEHFWQRITCSGEPPCKLGEHDFRHAFAVAGVHLVHLVALPGRSQWAGLKHGVVECHERLGRQKDAPVDRLRQWDGVLALRRLGQIVAARAFRGKYVGHDGEDISLRDVTTAYASVESSRMKGQTSLARSFEEWAELSDDQGNVPAEGLQCRYERNRLFALLECHDRLSLTLSARGRD